MQEVSSFKLDILREDVKKEYKKKTNPTLNAFKDICFDIFSEKLQKIYPNIRFTDVHYFGELNLYSFLAFDEDNITLVWLQDDKEEKGVYSHLNIIEKLLKDNFELQESILNLNEIFENKNLSQFYFCNNILLPTKERFLLLEKKIRKIFNQSLSKIYGLEHIKQLDTNFFTWREIYSFLVKDKYIYNKWIGISKSGIYNHTQPLDDLIGYRQYLMQKNLEYVKRDDFYYLYQNEIKDFYTESNILFQLLETNIYGFLIYGDSGTGKTRLLFELGYRALEYKDWIVLRITQELNDIYELELERNTNYLLLFDNIENLTFFDSEIFYKLKYYNPGANFKFIATCRTTYNRQIHVENIIKIDLSQNNQNENLFKAFVIEKILERIELKDISAEFFGNKLSFIVFLLYFKSKNLYENNLKNFETFSDWLIARFANSFSQDNLDSLNPKIIYLFTIFPLPTFDIYHDFRDILKILVKDCWIERRKLTTGEKLEVVHDSLVDVILDKHLTNNTYFIYEEIREFMAFAKENKAPLNVFNSFERIIESEPFQPLPIFYNFWFEKFWEDPSSFQVLKSAIYERYIIVYKYMDLVLGEFLKEDKIYKLFIALITQFKEKEGLKIYIKKWLKENPLEIEVGFVLRYWITITKDTQTFREEFYVWLSEYYGELDTGLVLSGFLKYDNEPFEIVENVIEWLNRYPDYYETGYLIESWLNATGNKDIVRKYLQPWIDKFKNKKQTGLVIAAWLNAGGDLSQVKVYYIQWLEKYPMLKETGWLIHGWLYSKGDIYYIEKYMKDWLENYPLEDVTGTLIGLWLKMGGEKGDVEKSLHVWLTRYPTEKAAVMPMIFWLDSGGKKELIESFIIPWIEKNPTTDEAYQLVKAWNKAGGKNEVIKKYIFFWMRKFPRLI